MADFTIEAVSGLTLVAWEDPATTGIFPTPTRLNPQPGLPHQFWRSGAPSSEIDIWCRVDGVLGPADIANPRLFTWRWVDRPYEPLPPIQTLTGFSSRVRFPLGALGEGHFTIQALRTLGGAVGFSFDVVETL